VAHSGLVCGNPTMHRWLYEHLTEPVPDR
jgi:hypothetical protein